MTDMCPSMEADLDGDGLLTNEEASGEYGDVFMALTTEGDASAESGLAIDRMPAYGLLTKILHYDPITSEEVPATTVQILEDFLRLIGKEEELP